MPTPSLPRRRSGLLACAALFGAALAPSAAHAAYAVGEQIDRADGASGGIPWAQNVYTAKVNYARPFAISDDGRFAFLTYPTSDTTRGLYRRDLLLNTLRLVADDVRPTGWTRSGQYLSAITSRALAAADTNGTADLYLLDPFSGAATLASTAPGGAALGGVTSGAVTADATAVVYSRPGGTSRRVLASATASTLSPRAMLPYEDFAYPHLDATPHLNVTREALSSDGTRVVVEGRFVATSSGDVELPDLPAGDVDSWHLNPAGTEVVRARRKAGGVWEAVIRTLSTGSERVVSTGNSTPAYVFVNAISPDGTTAHVTAHLSSNGSSQTLLGTLDLRTGALVQKSDSLPAVSANSRVFSWNDRYGVFRDINLFAVPVQAGAMLPGGVDAASPLVYLSYHPGCSSPSYLTQYGGRPYVELTRATASTRGLAPVASKVVVTVRAGAGSPIINQFTLSSQQKTESPLNQPFSAANVYTVAKIDGAVTANGQTAYDSATVPSYVASKCLL